MERASFGTIGKPVRSFFEEETLKYSIGESDIKDSLLMRPPIFKAGVETRAVFLVRPAGRTHLEVRPD
jgi:hypothetical protein